MASVHKREHGRSSVRIRAAGLLIASTLASLFFAEIAVRSIAPQEARLETPGMYIRDSALGYRLSPRYRGHLGNRVEYMTTITTDDIGLRSSDESTPDAQTRIVVLGDSFAFGQGVEASEAFPSKLEKDLGTSRLQVRVLNAGTPGYGTRQQAAWLERFGQRVSPSLIRHRALIAHGPGDIWCPA